MTRTFAVDATPHPAIKVQILITGKPAVGLVELARKIGYQGTLSRDQKPALGRAFDDAVIPIKRGQTILFSVRVMKADGSWRNVTTDPRLYIDVTLSAFTFERTGRLIAVPASGMPEINTGIIYPVHVYFFPDEHDRKTFGYNEIYFKPIE